MANAAGITLAAGGMALANDMLYGNASQGSQWTPEINWRIIPATLVLAVIMQGISSVSEPFGKGLAGLVFIAALVKPISPNNKSLLDNLASSIGGK